MLLNIANVPKNNQATDLHRDFGVETIAEMVKKHANSHETKIKSHINERRQDSHLAI